MSQVNTEETKTIISIFCKLRSVIHDIDELSDAVIFKRETKQRINNFLNFIEKQVNPIAKAFDPEEAEYFNTIVQKIDEICNQINVEQNTEENGPN